MKSALSPEQLRRRIDPASLGVRTSEEIEPLEGIIGQKRAVSALHFGLDIQEMGFNIYVAGPPGIGKMTAVQSFLEELARQKETPPDWCYVNNFDDAYQPKALRLPAGRGRELQHDMKSLIEHLRRSVPRTFESEEYGARRSRMLKALDEQRTQLREQLNQKASKAGFVLEATPLGIAMLPLVEGKPIDEREMQALPAEAREAIDERRKGLQEEIKAVMKQLRKLEQAAKETVQALDRQVALHVVGGLIDDLKEKYRELPEVLAYLDAVQADVLENIEAFKSGPQKEEGPTGPAAALQAELAFRKFQVNLLVDNSKVKGAPVVVELNPSHNNLFGRVEKETIFGSLYTDLTMIKPGSLHRANGGYLVLPADDVLQNLLSWDGLKRALRGREIQMEEIGERLGYLATKSLRPQPIPLDAKVVLVGRTLYYYLLHHHDEDFPELFKVLAEFDTRTTCREESLKDFLAFLCSFCRKQSLKHLESGALARVLEHALRLAEDQEKLSTHFGALVDIVREAHYWACQEGAERIGAAHVKRALDEKVYRSSLMRERIQEMVERGTILISTDGEAVGQVNGLSVISMGDYQFGRPSRITASVGLGRGGIVDIEREVELGGPLHSKGVHILRGYLARKFSQDKPLTMAARLVFEQSYQGVDGDSASSAELYALLSALSSLPIRQSFAVTGSVNQQGQVQAIGGVNEKIEGFFDLCRARGLDGGQGVLIPHSNVKHLMLREDVVDAVRDGKFQIHAVETIEQGIEILTGTPAGERDAQGRFPEGTVNHGVDRSLLGFGERLRKFAAPRPGEQQKDQPEPEKDDSEAGPQET
jgi:predicted ATP-dependent protease